MTCLAVLRNVFQILLAIFFKFPIVVIGLAVGTVLRWTVILVAKVCHRDLKAFDSGMRSIFACGEDVNMPMNMIGILILDGLITADWHRKRFEERVFKLRKPDGTLVFAGLQMYCTRFLGYPFWRREVSFDLSRHIRNYDYLGDLGLPESPTEFDLQNVAGPLTNIPWQKDQSPWEILIIENYNGLPQTAIVNRCDHVLGDGFSALKLARIVLQAEFQTPRFKAAERFNSNWRKTRLMLQIPLDALREAIVQSTAARLPFPRISPDVKVVFCPCISVESIKAIKNYYGVSYNSVLFAAINGAICRAIKKSGNELPPELTVSTVLPKLNHPGGFAFHTYYIFVRMLLGGATPEIRLRQTDNSLGATMKSSSFLLTDIFAKMAANFPKWCLEQFTIYAYKRNLVGRVAVAIFPVTTNRDTYEGIELLDYFSVSGTAGNLRITVGAAGVNNKQRVCFCINKSAFGDPDILASIGDYFMEEIQALQLGMI